MKALAPIARNLWATIIITTVMIILAAGCDDSPDSDPLGPVVTPSFHPSGWMDEQSALFHSAIVADSGFAYCRQCHEIALSSDTSKVTCGSCHPGWDFGCIGCHGGVDSRNGAPPSGIKGEMLRTDIEVGAHTVHLGGGALSDGIPCGSCHRSYLAIESDGHLGADSVAEVVFRGISAGKGTWDREAATCGSTYCHGNFTGGKLSNVPVWTAESGQATCGSCHDVGTNPATLRGKHRSHVLDEGYECYWCHRGTVDAENQIVGKGKHVNGVNDIQFLTPGTYSHGTCADLGCHEDDEWW